MFLATHTAATPWDLFPSTSEHKASMSPTNSFLTLFKCNSCISDVLQKQTKISLLFNFLPQLTIRTGRVWVARNSKQLIVSIVTVGSILRNRETETERQRERDIDRRRKRRKERGRKQVYACMKRFHNDAVHKAIVMYRLSYTRRSILTLTNKMYTHSYIYI